MTATSPDATATMPVITRAQARANARYAPYRTPANRVVPYRGPGNAPGSSLGRGLRSAARVLFGTEQGRSAVAGMARALSAGRSNVAVPGPPRRYGRLRQRARALIKRRSYIPGTYHGKFKKPTAAGMKESKAKFSSNGFMQTTEVTGSVNDPDCVYLTHTALVPVETIKIIVQALVRKLLKKAIGYNCTNVNEPIQAFTLNADWMVVLATESLDTGIDVNHQFATPSLCTIENIAVHYLPFFRAYAQGGAYDNVANVTELLYLQLFSRDVNGAASEFRLEGQLDLKDEIVHVYSKSNMKIQNRSLAASGSESTESVSNNPLVGRSYDIKGGLPKIRDTAVNVVLNSVTPEGVRLARAAEFSNAAGNVYKEPPSPYLIVNCGGSSKIRLEPGAIKSDSITVTYTKPLLTFLKKMGDPFYAVLNGNKYAHLIGKCRMYALEDVINVNATARIEIAYEVNREVGAYLTSRAIKHAQGTFSAVTYSNQTPV